MLEEFRRQANESYYIDEEPKQEVVVHTRRQLLGMTPTQRFIVAFLLLIITVLLSGFCLLATNRVLLPF